tara:strand:- start:1713 stop:2981 length:1269 start_codon:yes stop_codon:yes gene_type:complete
MIFSSKFEKFIFYTIPVILFSLLPFSLITGPFVPDLTVSLISLLFLIYCFKEKKYFFFDNKFFYFFLIFWFYLIINSLFNNFNLDSLKISFFYFRYAVFVIAIIALLNVNDKFIKYFFYCILICFISLILDGFYQYFSGENILGFKLRNTQRVSSFFGDQMILGSYLSRLWPIFFGLSLFIVKEKKLVYFLILIFILSEVLIFISGERVAFFYLNLSAVFVILFSQKLKKLRLSILLLSISLIILINFINPSSKERMIDKTIKEMNLTNSIQNQNNENIYIFTKVHTEYYISAFKMFLDNKFFGVGVKNFRNFCSRNEYKSEFSCSNHPHNTYIQILSEIGIIGFLFVFAIILYFMKNLFKHLNWKFNNKIYYTDFEICVLSSLVIYLWPIAPTGNVFNNWLNIIMIVNLPFLAWSRNLNKK